MLSLHNVTNMLATAPLHHTNDNYNYYKYYYKYYYYYEGLSVHRLAENMLHDVTSTLATARLNPRSSITSFSRLTRRNRVPRCHQNLTGWSLYHSPPLRKVASKSAYNLLKYSRLQSISLRPASQWHLRTLGCNRDSRICQKKLNRQWNLLGHARPLHKICHNPSITFWVILHKTGQTKNSISSSMDVTAVVMRTAWITVMAITVPEREFN